MYEDNKYCTLEKFIVYEDTCVKGQLLIYEDINIVSVYYYQRGLGSLTLLFRRAGRHPFYTTLSVYNSNRYILNIWNI